MSILGEAGPVPLIEKTAELVRGAYSSERCSVTAAIVVIGTRWQLDFAP
jgi:hypothetical protein